MCGKVTNVKLRLVKPVDGFVLGEVYEPFWYRNHDMNRAPIPDPVLYFKIAGQEKAADLSCFVDAMPS